MQETKYFTCIYHTVFLFCSKRCHIKFKTIFDYENQKQKRITKYCKNRSVDIDYEDFMKIYTECAKETYSFLTTETILPASDPLKFREYIFQSYKIDRS